MTTIEVDPGVQVVLDALAAMDPVSMADIGPEAARDLFKAMAFGGEPIPVAEIADRTIPGPAGDIPVRVYRPAPGELPVLVWYHGGGWVLGDLDTTDTAARQLAAEGDCVVVSVDYRLAPEHAYPAAADDAWAALRWVVGHAGELGVDATRVAVGGDSAGGNLAAIVALRARDEGLALRHQLLVYPVTDLTASHGSRVENGEGYLLTKDTMDWFESCYLQGQDPKDPGASPLHAGDLTGLAPAHVLTAGFDPLRDEGEAYAEALTAAGVATVDDRYPTMVHGFFQMGGISPAAGAAASRAAALLKAALAAATE